MRNSVVICASLLLLSSCNTPVAASDTAPALCIAAFNYALVQARGTPMERDPEIEELKIRILYEQRIANKYHSINNVERQVQNLAQQFTDDRSGALKMAGRCLANQEMGDDYRRERPKLVEMIKYNTERTLMSR